jgi:hypothetical protein
VVGLRVGVVPALTVLGIGIVAQVLYVRWFPRMSKWMGYGSVADTAAKPAAIQARLPRVTLYTANVRPFCPHHQATSGGAAAAMRGSIRAVSARLPLASQRNPRYQKQPLVVPRSRPAPTQAQG